MDFKNITTEVAKEGFGCGVDCSMAVAGHCSHMLDISETDALKMAAAFGGGMWRGEVCGCVAGALMCLGLKFGNGGPVEPEVKDAFLAKKAAFEEAFIKENGTLICKELLGYDISKPEEMEKIMEENLFMTKCPNFVMSACKIMDEMLK